MRSLSVSVDPCSTNNGDPLPFSNRSSLNPSGEWPSAKGIRKIKQLTPKVSSSVRRMPAQSNRSGTPSRSMPWRFPER